MSDFFRMSHIYKRYQTGDEALTVLKDVNLTVEPGEYLSVLGPSGSGKSTLMNIAGCLDTPSEGEYVLNGAHVDEMDAHALALARSREIGFIFQSSQLLSRLDAQKNVELPLIYAGVRPSERARRAREMLDRVGLSDRMRHFPSQLSGGQQQRVAIARAIAGSPRLLLADEPTGNLDAESALQVMAIFRRLNANGVTVVFITHDAELARAAGRTLQIDNGHIISDTKKQWERIS